MYNDYNSRPNQFSDTIRLFLDSIGRSEEYEFYLKKFQSDRSACFTILCPDPDCLNGAAEQLAYNLNFLLGLGTLPALLLTGPEASAMEAGLEAAGAGPYHRVNLDAALLEGPPEYLAKKLKEETEQARERNSFLLFRAQEPAVLVLKRVIRYLSRRVLFLRMQGALKDRAGASVSMYRVLRNEPALSVEEDGLRETAMSLLEDEPGLHLAITSPFLMLKEIFTVKGAGTIIRPGSQITVKQSVKELDRERLLRTLSFSFGRPLLDPALLEKMDYFYYDENYQGAILLRQHPAGLYLSKFAVDTEARGLGIAQELWDKVTGDHSEIFWRSRSENSVNRWYSRIAEGLHRTKRWTIFWRGIQPENISDIIQYCRDLPEDFEAL